MIYRNEEHYADPTAGNAFRNIARQSYGPARKKRRTGGQVREERHENKGRGYRGEPYRGDCPPGTVKEDAV